MKTITTYILGQCLLLAAFGVGIARAADTVPTDIQQPGTQPQEINSLESPDKCDNCHTPSITDHWRGSMMANAGRDPIFWATLAVVEQDLDAAGDLRRSDRRHPALEDLELGARAPSGPRRARQGGAQRRRSPRDAERHAYRAGADRRRSKTDSA